MRPSVVGGYSESFINVRRPVHDKWLHRIEPEVDDVDGWRCPPPFSVNCC